MKPIAEVILSPALVPYYDLEGKVVVVIDILRATTTMCYAFMNGAERIIPIESIGEAKKYLDGDYVVAAERDGLVAEGFTLGNSPESFTPEIVNGKTVVLTTTNGTYMLNQCLTADKIVTGAFTNISALCNWLIGWNQPVVLACAGWKNKFNLEDTVFAGAVLHTIKDHFDLESDSCVAALNLFLTASQNLEGYMRHSNHAQRFERLGIDDLPICLKTDVTDIVPIYSNGVLVPLRP